MKLLVSGSRSISDKEFVKKAIFEMFSEYEITSVIHGGARGVDSLADEIFHEMGMTPEVIKPDWKKYGRRAGMIRNSEMLEKADILLAVWDGNSPGTADAILKAYQKKIPVNIQMYAPSFNVWSVLEKESNPALCITTNGFVGRKGAVMGRGIALQTKVFYPGAEKKLGELIRKNGNIVQIFEKSDVTLISFPVKPKSVRFNGKNVVDHAKKRYKEGDFVPGFHAKADLKIIERSFQQLKDLIKKEGLKKIYCPLPGTGAGELSSSQVIEVIRKAKIKEAEFFTKTGFVNIFKKAKSKKF